MESEKQTVVRRRRPTENRPTHFGRMPRDELADPATDTAEEPAAVNVYQRVRCRPLYSRPVRHDL